MCMFGIDGRTERQSFEELHKTKKKDRQKRGRRQSRTEANSKRERQSNKKKNQDEKTDKDKRQTNGWQRRKTKLDKTKISTALAKALGAVKR